MRYDYPFDEYCKASLAANQLRQSRIGIRFTPNTPKNRREPLTLVHRLEFDDSEIERVEAMLSPCGWLP